MSISSKEFIWIRKKWCTECGKMYETAGKFSKKCPSCVNKPRVTGEQPHFNHWKTFLNKHDITDKDLRRVRKRVRSKKSKRVSVNYGC